MTEPEYENYSFWDRIGNDRPIILYGTGNGADKIIDELMKKGKSPDGVFASDGFVRNRSFRGMTVRSYGEIIDRFGSDITVLVSFGSFQPRVIDFVKELDRKHELIVPDVPLYGGELFDYDCFLKNKNMIDETIGLFCDEQSQKLFADAINYRLTGKLKYLFRCEPFEESVKTLISGGSVRSLIDGGAYRGDTLEIFRSVFPNLSTVFAVDADPTSLRKLSEAFADGRIKSINAVLSDKDGKTSVLSSSGRGTGRLGSSRRAKRVFVDEKKIDTILDGSPVDLIKLDVEGDEKAALKGASGTISAYSPDLIVSLYHRTDDIFDIPEMIKSADEKYDLYLRRPMCLPMWDLNLFAIKRREE